MQKITVFVAVWCCVVVQGAVLGACQAVPRTITLGDREIFMPVIVSVSSISVCVFHGEQEQEEVYQGHWDVRGLQVNRSFVEQEIFSVGEMLYDHPGPSDFLEALMDKIRISHDGDPRFWYSAGVKHLHKGIQNVERGLTWVTTFYPEKMQYFPDEYPQYCGCYKRITPLIIPDEEHLRTVVKMCGLGFTIRGLAKRTEATATIAD